MAATENAIRAALVAAVTTGPNMVPGLRARPRWTGRVDPPVVIFERTRWEPNATFGKAGTGKQTYDFVGWVFVSASDFDRAGSQAADFVTGGAGVNLLTAIETDRTLGGVVDSAAVTGMDTPERITEENGTKYLAQPVRIEVLC